MALQHFWSRRNFAFLRFLLLSVFLWSIFLCANCQLKQTFYSKTCPNVEEIVNEVVSTAIFKDRTMASGLLRLLFHDCFVEGCDASVLLDSVNGQQAEKDAPPNQSLRGYDVIDSAKAKVEAVCPGVVSCADILAFAARDSVVQMGGQTWNVSGGRRDGSVSNGGDANSNLLSFSASVPQLVQGFQSKGLTSSEMVTLSGAHTFGGAACSSFSDRLYSFNGTVAQDPSLDTAYAETLKFSCPNTGSSSTTSTTFVNLDVSTPDIFDNMYYQNLMIGKGLMRSDQSLGTDPLTKGMVRQLAGNNSVFMTKFAKAMVKMSAIGVKTGTAGEIRSNCRVRNAA